MPPGPSWTASARASRPRSSPSGTRCVLLEPFTTDLGPRASGRSTGPGPEAAPRSATRSTPRCGSASRGPRRTAIVVFSDGIDNISWLLASEVVEAAARSDAIVYGVTVRDRDDRKEPFLRDVVRATGGQLFEAESERDLRGPVPRRPRRHPLPLRAELRPVDAPTRPGWHALEVRLKRGQGRRARPAGLLALAPWRASTRLRRAFDGAFEIPRAPATGRVPALAVASSPASTRTGIQFCGGGSGQVAYGVKAQGGL